MTWFPTILKVEIAPENGFRLKSHNNWSLILTSFSQPQAALWCSNKNGTVEEERVNHLPPIMGTLWNPYKHHPDTVTTQKTRQDVNMLKYLNKTINEQTPKLFLKKASKFCARLHSWVFCAELMCNTSYVQGDVLDAICEQLCRIQNAQWAPT